MSSRWRTVSGRGAAAYRRPDDITVHTVSLGGESRLLRELAGRNGGRYVVR